jgi:hypothetical protein
MISTSDYGWMAAVIDMKGHVIVKNNKTRNTEQIVLTVDAKDPRIAQRLAALTGTKPEPHGMSPMSDFMRRGCTEHCPESHIHMYRENVNIPETTRWSVTGLAMGIVLWNLRRHMSTYSEYAKYMGIAFDNAVYSGQGSGMVRVSVNRLRDLGWRIPGKVTTALAKTR